ncbi:hypothetical protein PR048_003644 [Dryococelus australis]|uniref:Transposase Tc1-like domain-containing protein n=1 Tax=Dryococelus australis TaxID=614101 RepID=A0ABQ9IPW4_9NEOP|nr:hypothetical protein PR048_003644 [Dryococelus australis]
MRRRVFFVVLLSPWDKDYSWPIINYVGAACPLGSAGILWAAIQQLTCAGQCSEWRSLETKGLGGPYHAKHLFRPRQQLAVVAERLDCSLPTKANRVRFPAGSLPDFCKWESCRTMPLVAGFLGDLPFPPPLHSSAALFSPHFTLIGSQDRLASSPSTKANRARSPAEPLPDLHMRESRRMMPPIGGFLPLFHSGVVPYSPSSAHETSLLRAAQISSLHCNMLFIQRHCCPLSTGQLPKSIFQNTGITLILYAQCRNARAGETGYPRENPPTSGIVRYRDDKKACPALGWPHLTCTVQHHEGNIARLARRSDEALEVRVSVARIAPSLLDLGRGVPTGIHPTLKLPCHDTCMVSISIFVSALSITSHVDERKGPAIKGNWGSMPRYFPPFAVAGLSFASRFDRWSADAAILIVLIKPRIQKYILENTRHQSVASLFPIKPVPRSTTSTPVNHLENNAGNLMADSIIHLKAVHDKGTTTLPPPHPQYVTGASEPAIHVSSCEAMAKSSYVSHAALHKSQRALTISAKSSQPRQYGEVEWAHTHQVGVPGGEGYGVGSFHFLAHEVHVTCDCDQLAARPAQLYQHVSEFERGTMIGLRETGLSYRDISALTGHAATTMMRVCNQLRGEGRTQRRAGTGPRNVTTARDDRHLGRMAVTDRTASSSVLARHWSDATGVDLSVLTVRRRLLRMDWWHACHCVVFHCSETTNPSDCNRHVDAIVGMLGWQNVVFTDESRFNPPYIDGRIRVRCYRGDRNLAAYTVERHSG